MATGKIKTIIPDKGFGFIAVDGAPSNGKELFFHSSAVLSGDFDTLQVGQAVTFDQEPDPRDSSRSRAQNVQRSEAGAAS